MAQFPCPAECPPRGRLFQGTQRSFPWPAAACLHTQWALIAIRLSGTLAFECGGDRACLRFGACFMPSSVTLSRQAGACQAFAIVMIEKGQCWQSRDAFSFATVSWTVKDAVDEPVVPWTVASSSLCAWNRFIYTRASGERRLQSCIHRIHLYSPCSLLLFFELFHRGSAGHITGPLFVDRVPLITRCQLAEPSTVLPTKPCHERDVSEHCHRKRPRPLSIEYIVMNGISLFFCEDKDTSLYSAIDSRVLQAAWLELFERPPRGPAGRRSCQQTARVPLGIICS